MYNLDHLRQTEFPLSKDVLYFNHASISPIPIRTRDKVQWAAGKLAEHPMQHFMTDGLPMFEGFNQQIADYINATSPKEIVWITSVSMGLNLIAQALDLERGDNIAFCDTEFPSNVYPWMSLQRDGIEIRQVPSVNGGLTLDALREYVDDRTRLVSASAIQFFSGHRTDLEAIGNFCRERGILFVVDAIQAAGHMKIDVQQMKIDILATGSQKSLIAPPGTGFLYVRNEIVDQLQPRSIGANATRNWIRWLKDDYDITPEEGAARFAMGTSNLLAMWGLLESMSLLTELGVENIDQHTTGLAAEAIQQMGAIGYEPLTVREEHGPIATFKAKDMTAEEADKLVMWLNERNISIVKHLSKQGIPHLRLSFHCYNTKAEIEKFIDIIKGYSL